MPPAPRAPGSSRAPATALATSCSSRGALGQQRQLPEPETMLLRHPHAVPSNALQREDGRREKSERTSRGQSRSAAEPGGAGTGGWRRTDWRRGPRERRGPPSSLPPSAAAIGEAGGPGSPGPGQAVGRARRRALTPAPLTPSLPRRPSFVFSEVVFWGVPAGTHLGLGDSAGVSGEKGLLNEGKVCVGAGNHPPKQAGCRDCTLPTWMHKPSPTSIPSAKVWEQL